MKRYKKRDKSWWSEHWDELIFAVGFIIAGYIMAKGMGLV